MTHSYIGKPNTQTRNLKTYLTERLFAWDSSTKADCGSFPVHLYAYIRR